MRSMASSALRFFTASSASTSLSDEFVGRSTPKVALTFTSSTRLPTCEMPVTFTSREVMLKAEAVSEETRRSSMSLDEALTPTWGQAVRFLRHSVSEQHA